MGFFNVTLIMLVTSVVCFIALMILMLIRTEDKKLTLIKTTVCFILFIGVFQIVPYVFFQNGLEYSVAGQDYKIGNKYYLIAEKTSFSSVFKGNCLMNRAMNAYQYEKNGPYAIELYEEAYKYLKSYNELYPLPFLYVLNGEDQKAIEVEEATGKKLLSTSIYVMKKEYKKALGLLGNGENPWEINKIAVIYKKTGKPDEALKLHQKALNTAPNAKSREIMVKQFEDYEANYNEFMEFKRKELHFIDRND